MPTAGFEPAIPASEWPHNLPFDRSAKSITTSLKKRNLAYMSLLFLECSNDIKHNLSTLLLRTDNYMLSDPDTTQKKNVITLSAGSELGTA